MCTEHWCESESSCSWLTYCCWSGNLWWCSLWGRFRMWSNRLYWPGLFGCQLLQTYLPLVKHFLYIFEFLYNSLGIGLDKEKANNKWLSALDWASEERTCITTLRLELEITQWQFWTWTVHCSPVHAFCPVHSFIDQDMVTQAELLALLWRKKPMCCMTTLMSKTYCHKYWPLCPFGVGKEAYFSRLKYIAHYTLMDKAIRNF